MTGLQMIFDLRAHLFDGDFLSRWSIDDPALGALDAPSYIPAGSTCQLCRRRDCSKWLSLQRTVPRDQP